MATKKHLVCVLNPDGKKNLTDTVENNRKVLDNFFAKYKGATVAIEAGIHSPWISRQLVLLGCTVLVGIPRKLRVIWASDDKADIRDAEMLAKIGRFDPELLYPINHRGEQAQVDLEIIKAREILVNNRSSVINKFFTIVSGDSQHLMPVDASNLLIASLTFR